ncbi:13320_t:CDS:2 [Rhizophagus irregularis]|nr:13320_t:CDS:2 [Rhizophagus irregularis]
MEYTNLKSPADLENQPSEPILQYSYSKYNNNTKIQKNHKKPQNHKNINQNFHPPYNNDTYTSNSQNYTCESRNEEDKNMLNYIEYNIFDDNDTLGMASTSQPHDTPIPSFPQLHMDLNKTIHSIHSLPSLNNDNTKPNIHVYTDNKGNTKGSGVSMIITDQLQKHIIKTNTFFGRILTEIENILTNAMHNHFECIVLGDLNISFDKLKKSNHYPIWRREIKTILKNFGLKDLLKSFHERLSPTHSTKRNDGPDIQSRIDYIFTSSNILQHSFYAYTHSISEDLFTTDHKALSCYLTQDYFRNKFNSSRKSLEKSPTYKPNTNPQIRYKYHSMTTESWSNYKLINGIIYRQHINNSISPDKTPEQQIEFYWSNIKDIINQTKEKCIPFSEYKKYTKHDHPLCLRQNNNKILTLRTILRKFSNIKINRIQGDHDKWKDYWKLWGTLRKQILVIDVHFNAKRTIWLPVNLTIDNIFDVKKDLQSLLRVINVLHKQEEDSWTINKINKYINDRNNNLIHDQKRMINSILDRKPQKITLDRLHYYDQQTNQFQFTNNPHIIAEQTNLHFQCLGKDLNEIRNIKEYKSIQDLPLYWRSTYEPINNRNCKHMNSLSEDFSIEELSQRIYSTIF